MRAAQSLWMSLSVAALIAGAATLAHAQTGPQAPSKSPERASPPAASTQATNPPPAAPAQPAGRQKILDELFDRLAKAQDRDEARGLAGAIERVWSRSGSDTADLLMERVTALFRQKDFKIARDMLDRLIEIEPQWSEVWSRRATTRFMDRDYAGAMEDLANVLRIEPRHFMALVGVGSILEREENKAQALRVFRRALEINPQLDEIRSKVEKLTIEVDGREI
jgi:tetratricopeptide (TPR) repeat protein